VGGGVFDIANDKYNVPVGLGIGKVVPTRKAVFNLFVDRSSSSRAVRVSRSCRSSSASTRSHEEVTGGIRP